MWKKSNLLFFWNDRSPDHSDSNVFGAAGGRLFPKLQRGVGWKDLVLVFHRTSGVAQVQLQQINTNFTTVTCGSNRYGGISCSSFVFVLVVRPTFFYSILYSCWLGVLMLFVWSDSQIKFKSLNMSWNTRCGIWDLKLFDYPRAFACSLRLDLPYLIEYRNLHKVCLFIPHLTIDTAAILCHINRNPSTLY